MLKFKRPLCIVTTLLCLNVPLMAKTITINLNNVSVKQAMDELKSITGYTFVYSSNDLDSKKKISVSANDEDIEAVIGQILNGQKVSYEIKDKTIIVKKITNTTNTQQSAPKKVTGTVVDASGIPVIGANVMVKGTTNGSITDMNGNFTLDVPEGSVLEISYIGYLTQTVKANSSNISVALKEDTQKLDEVVVVGYGTQKKVNLTGSIESVKSDRIDSKPVSNLASALTGEAAGVTITQTSGQPSSESGNIRIRGVGTWENASPLVLVDGIAMNINDVVPSDVENVSVLKDAASAAIYGSRAANGVILITTKKGKKGKVSLNYTGNVGFQSPTRTPKMASSWQYAELYNQSMENEGKSSSLFPDDRIERLKNGGDPDKNEANTDWYDEVLRSAALQHSHNISISGGSDKISFMGSLGYFDQKGVIPSTEYERYNARLNTVTEVTSWFKLNFNLSYVNDNESDSAAGDNALIDIDGQGGAYNAFQKIGRAVPYMPVQYSDGTWSFLSAPTNPVRMVTADYGDRKINRNNISVLISPEFNPVEGLNIKGVFAYENNTRKKKQFGKIVEYGEFAPVGQSATVVVPRNQQMDKWEQWNNLTASLTAEYEKTIDKNYFKVMAGSSLETFRWAYTKASRKDFPNNDFSEINAGDPNTSYAEGNSTYSALASIFGRVNYVFDDKYLFEANIRYDGSSKFAKGNRFGLFPSFSVGWRISEEDFFENLRAYFPNLKIRASWGQLGNQQIADYQYYSTFGAGDNYLFNSISTGYKETLMGNPNITWETSTNLNLGIDFSLFDNKLQTTFDWYNRNTDDILLALKAPATLGIDPPMQNAGSVQNKGWDLSIVWRDKIGEDFNYMIGFNLSDVKNKITDLKGYKSPTSDLTTRIEGSPIDAIYGWVSKGICTTQDEYEKYKDLMHTYNANWNIGDIILEDRNNDGQIGADDKTIIGNQIPRFTFGLNLGFDYKNFDFSCFFQGVGKADGYVTEELIKPMGVYSALEEHYTQSFNPKNPTDDAYFPRITNSWAYNYANMSHWVQNAAYVRLKNISLGYTFKISSWGIDRLRVMLSGENLFTLTKFKIWDPETKVGARSTYPQVAVYTMGVNLVF